MVERKTRVGRSAVGFGGIGSRGDSCRHYIETKSCIWHEYVLSVSQQNLIVKLEDDI